jgi:ABC-2 type transport system ATP-binding protein
MKQRLAIASALLNDPEILILDEPTNGLDPQGIHQIRKIIQDIASNGTTILLASHLLDEVEKVCSHVVIIQKGKKLYEGKTDEMTASFGFIDLSTDKESLKRLETILTNLNEVKSVTASNNLLTAVLQEELTAATINKLAFKNKITLTHLSKRKPSLEQQFLTLTNQ